MVSPTAVNLKYSKANRVIRKRLVSAYSVVCIALLLISLFATLVIVFDLDKPDYYGLLFLLPIAFILFLLINLFNIEKIFSNFGTVLLVVLEFVRLVIAPLLLSLSGYSEVITINVAVNTHKAILLMLYETVAVALAINIPVKLKRTRVCSPRQYSRGIKRLHVVMAIYSIILIVLCAIAPDILLSHRTIFGVFFDERFTAMQLDKVIAAFTGTTARRYCLILSRLLLTPFRLLFPAYLIIVIRYKKLKRGKLLSVIISFFPFLLVSDVIAQSIYFTLFLLLLTVYVYGMGYKQIVKIFALAALAVLVYFVTRFFIAGLENGDGFIENMSRKLFTYFSGLNIVSGAFNYPAAWAEKGQYFLYEFLRAIPMHNILGIDDNIIPSALFNDINGVVGQIPTTIGMGYYYLGTVFAPILSMLVAYAAKYFGTKMSEETIPLYRLTFMFAAFMMALGIVMYNMSIAFNAIVQMILPIYIIVAIAFGRKKVYKH